MSEQLPIGVIAWTDLTVPDAERLRDFYESVAGWVADPVSQGDYDDYNMLPAGSDIPAAGICHARGVNAALPPVWMIYITVPDLAASLERCAAQGGKVLLRPADFGPHTHMAVLQDPAGAVFALFQPGDHGHDAAEG